MRRCMNGLALAILLGLAGTVLAGGKDGKSGGSWWPTWLGGKSKPSDKKEPTLQVIEKPVGLPAPVDLASSQREKEENSYFRRLDVCDKLEVLAVQAGDGEQVRRIHQLKERIWAIYQQRTAHLSGSPASAEMDETLLEQNLGTTTRQAALLSGETGKPGEPGEFAPGGRRAVYAGGTKR